MGMRGVTQHFQTISVHATATTNEAEERFKDVIAETEVRFPVFNLMRDAKVNADFSWVLHNS